MHSMTIWFVALASFVASVYGGLQFGGDEIRVGRSPGRYGFIEVPGLTGFSLEAAVLPEDLSTGLLIDPVYDEGGQLLTNAYKTIYELHNCLWIGVNYIFPGEGEMVIADKLLSGKVKHFPETRVRENQFVYVAVTWKEGTVQLFFNGELIGTESGFTCSAPTTFLSIGAVVPAPCVITARRKRNPLCDRPGPDEWEGAVDLIRMWNRLISLEEVQELAFSRIEGPQSCDLIAGWEFDWSKLPDVPYKFCNLADVTGKYVLQAWSSIEPYLTKNTWGGVTYKGEVYIGGAIRGDNDEYWNNALGDGSVDRIYAPPAGQPKCPDGYTVTPYSPPYLTEEDCPTLEGGGTTPSGAGTQTQTQPGGSGTQTQPGGGPGGGDTTKPGATKSLPGPGGGTTAPGSGGGTTAGSVVTDKDGNVISPGTESDGNAVDPAIIAAIVGGICCCFLIIIAALIVFFMVLTRSRSRSRGHITQSMRGRSSSSTSRHRNTTLTNLSGSVRSGSFRELRRSTRGAGAGVGGPMRSSYTHY